ncbi:MAG: hypothetical protein L0226_01640 [Acidobacteria bacterium]|nr:hypothetical protein [Acidobacteriota bacterium]
MESLSSGGFGSGYEEFRATIVNRSRQNSHEVTLIAPASPVRNSGSLIYELKRTVVVAASSTAQVSLLLPPLDLAGVDFAVIIDGQRQQGDVSAISERAGMWVGRVRNKISLLVSQSVRRSRLIDEPQVEEWLKDSTGNLDVAYLPYEFPVNEWSTNWLGYSRFDGVLVSADELQAMPESVRTALWRYMECGGSMFVLGSWVVPKEWQERLELISSAAIPKKALQTYYIGFGVLIVTGSVDPGQLDEIQWKKIKLHWEDSRPNDTYYRSISDINGVFSVIDRIGVPVRGLFILMILFVFVIGPVNLLWLARRGRKIWLLWTVPAISFVTCLAVSAFAFFGEGISATARTDALTILDEVSHRATTLGWMGFYSPVTPGEGLHFSYDTELDPRLPGRWDLRGGDRSSRTLDWTNDQHLASEWITARVPVYFKFRKSEMRRERLTVRQGTNDSVSIVNGLGAAIRQLWWADNSGNIYTATNIPAGDESKLTWVNLKAAGTENNLRDVFKDDVWLGMFNSLEVNPREALMPNSYLAVLDAAPFVEEGLRGVKNRKAKTLVYGIQRLAP